MQQKAEQQFNGTKQPTNVKEGETIIDRKPGDDSIIKNNVGDYVDFEEIE